MAVAIHRRRLGNFVNFYTSLSQLLTDNPASDAFAMFQDDVEAAIGLKTWCDDQLWPLDSGVVSLFTPRLHCGRTAGWRLLSPGCQRVCGAQALVFRRDMLQKFLSDPLVMHHLHARSQCDDFVVAGWVAREGLGIAYHTPSLVQHVGDVSSIFPSGTDRRNFADAVSSVGQVGTWICASARESAIGLVGPNTPTGLGYQNRDLAKHLRIDRWLVPQHPSWLTSLGPPLRKVRMDVVPDRPDDNRLKDWLRGLDWILFAERPFFANLVRVAAHSGIGVACIPNWEWCHPELEWLAFVDLMLCPTKHTFVQMSDWKRRYGFGWETVHVPWPIDTTRFQFRQRHVCRRFLFVNGWGGGLAQRLDGSPTDYGRKGIELIIEAARQIPHMPFVVHSLSEDVANLPSNIALRRPLADNIRLYDEGDVCVQPSHFEGIGLQLLECQAAGMPLVTTDAPPMNEYKPWRTIPVCESEVVYVGGGPIASQVMRPHDLIETLEPLLGADLCEASRQAREFVVREHSWEAAIGFLRHAMIHR